MRILIVTPYLPHPNIGHGGGTAVRQLVSALAQRHDVTVLSLLRPGEQDLVAATRGLGVSLETVPFLDQAARGRDRALLIGQRLGSLTRALATREPYYVAKYAGSALAAAARRIITTFDPDIVQVEYLQLAHVLRDLRRWRTTNGPTTRPYLVLDSHEYSALPRRRRAAEAGWVRRTLLRREAAAWDRLARRASRWADTMLCVTDQDRQLFTAAGAVNLATVPLGIDTPPFAREHTAAIPAQALFLGSFEHPPNRAAANLLCKRIWPAVDARLDGWQLLLAGPGSNRFLEELRPRPANVRALGYVADLDELFRRCRLFVAPLFEGGGIKIKILDAMARGIPVVTTPIGAEGITTADADHIGWATDVEEFVEAIIDAAESPKSGDERARRARLHIVDHFSWPAVVTRLETIYRNR